VTSPPTPLHKWRGEITQEFQDWVLDACMYKKLYWL